MPIDGLNLIQYRLLCQQFFNIRKKYMSISRITKAEKCPILIVRQDYIDLFNGNTTAACLLSFFEYWDGIKHAMIIKAKQANDIAKRHGDEPIHDESHLQFHRNDQLYSGLMGLHGKAAIAEAVKILVDRGYLSIHKNPISRYTFDNTKHYLLIPNKISEDLSKLYENYNEEQFVDQYIQDFTKMG